MFFSAPQLKRDPLGRPHGLLLNILRWFRLRFGKSPQQPAGLIGVLLDTNAPEGDRDDAAMDLGKYDDPAAEAALRQVGSDARTPEVIADSCGDSLGEIWARQGRSDLSLLDGLTPPARVIAAAHIESTKR